MAPRATGASRSSRSSAEVRGPANSAVAVADTDRPDHSEVLADTIGRHAWRVLLNMSDADVAPRRWDYGLPDHAINNIRASFVAMSPRERQTMHIELLRLVSLILSDVVTAVTRALQDVDASERNEVMVDVAEEDRDGDETSMVQGLAEHKAKKLKKASEKGVVRDSVTEVHGTEFDRLTRSLMASLERMSSQEALYCSQNLLNRLVQRYGGLPRDDGLAWPEDAESLLSGFITFGAQLGEPTATGSGQNDFFVAHWWNMVVPILPNDPAESEGSAEGKETTSAASSAPELARVVKQEIAEGEGTNWPLQAGEVGKVIDLNGSQPMPTTQPDSLLPDQGHTGPRTAKAEQVTRKVEKQVEKHEEHREVDGVAADDNGVTDHDQEALTCGHASTEVLRAMELECNRHSASLLRDWEDWTMAEEMKPTRQRGTTVVIRAGVRHQGVRGHPQSLLLHLDDGDQVNLTLQVHHDGTGH